MFIILISGGNIDTINISLDNCIVLTPATNFGL